MGNFSNSITERIKHTRIKKGFCLICGVYGKLSQDHVPPKGAITIGPAEQRHITELMGGAPIKPKGVKSNHGSTFRTICEKCNNEHIGGNDDEVARVCKELTEKIKRYFNQYNRTTNSITVKIDALKYTRAMIGHILSATSVAECTVEPSKSSYFTPLQNFVLGDDKAINLTHDIFYWFYPHKKHLSAKVVGFHNEGTNCMMSLLSFFPVAFLVTEKGMGTTPVQAKKLELSDEKIVLNLSLGNSKYIDFPFCEIEGNRFVALADFMCITSNPIGNK